MRRILSAIAVLPFMAACVTACGGASDVAGSVAGIKDPREALAASVQEMNEESYYLEYELDFPEDEAAASGTLVLVQRGDDNAVRIRAAEGEFALFSVGGEGYLCIGGTPPAGGSPIESGCYRSGGQEDDSADDLNGFFFDSTSIMDQIAADADAEITDAADRTVAGFDARCFDVEGPGNDAGVICIAKDSGLLVLIEGEFDGEPGRIQLVSAREPKDSDFELPFDVVDSPLNLFGASITGADPDAPHVPEKPERESIPSVRIAGPLYPWETTPALCPDFEIYETSTTIAPLPGGRAIVEDKFSAVVLDNDCEATGFGTDTPAFTADRGGNIYLVEPGVDGDRIVRIDPLGARTVVAGRACDSLREDCDQRPDGPAMEVVLGPIWNVAVSEDGNIWFDEWAFDLDDLDNIRRVTVDGRVETVETDLGEEIWAIAAGPDGSLVLVSGFGDAFVLAREGTATRLRGAGDSCFAVSVDGVIWSYDSLDGNLVATLPGGGSIEFSFRLEVGFDCASLAVEEAGDLLFLSGSWSSPPGLWRIPNPLVSR